jgi:hypothetical protein
MFQRIVDYSQVFGLCMQHLWLLDWDARLRGRLRAIPRLSTGRYPNCRHPVALRTSKSAAGITYTMAAPRRTAMTAIGVATSADGVHSARLDKGRPIVTPALTNPRYAKSRRTYDAGQPAILSYFTG